jgi:inner membrane transporter RhtA
MTVVPNLQVSVGINPAVSLAVTAMISVQLAAALSRPLMAEMGVPAFTWIRVVAGAAILLVLVRPRWYGRTPKAILAAFMLGATLAFMSATLFAAVNRLPLGVVVTIAFLGPLSVSVLSARGARPLALGLALVAGVGVTLVIAPVAGSGGGWTLDPLGIVFALASALGWALYIVLTRRVGRLFNQSDGLCFSLLAAAVLLTPTGLDGLDGLDGLERMPELSTLLAAVGLAILAPLLPCWLEMAALRRLGTQSFGILMSLEPAIATVLGMLILNETPGPQQIIGMACIILTSVAAVTLLERQMEG